MQIYLKVFLEGHYILDISYIPASNFTYLNIDNLSSSHIPFDALLAKRVAKNH